MQTGTEGSPRIPLEERREFVRIRHEVKLTCRVLNVPEQDAPTPVRNLGTGGLLLSTRKPLTLGVLLDMRTCLTEGVEFRLHGRVVWTDFNPASNHHESGICFVGLDNEQRKNVMALLGHGDGIERRKHIRLARQLLVEYRPSHRLLSRWRGAHTRDLSMGGAAIRTDQRLETGLEVRLRVHLDDRQPKPWMAAAIVLESQPAHDEPTSMMTSLRFMQLEADMSHRMATYISQKLSARIPGLGQEPL